MELVVVSLICAFGCAAIAGSKGRGRIGWFFLGLLTGPLGILIVGFMAPKAPQPTEAEVAAAWVRMTGSPLSN